MTKLKMMMMMMMRRRRRVGTKRMDPDKTRMEQRRHWIVVVDVEDQCTSPSPRKSLYTMLKAKRVKQKIRK